MAEGARKAAGRKEASKEETYLADMERIIDRTSKEDADEYSSTTIFSQEGYFSTVRTS
jgi:hypothetical protein